MSSTETIWFDVSLDTLWLTPVDMDSWPEDMNHSGSCMKEECLEHVVALNLDLLFPDEDLLLVGNQFPDWAEADVLAMDRFGLLRMMELKKRSANLGELQDQAIGYGLARDYRPYWTEHMARGLPYLPERIELGLEGFRLNARAEMLGAKYVTKHAPDLLPGPWRKLNRFEKAHVLANTLRRRRGAPQGPAALQNPCVHEVVDRLYGIPVGEIASDAPARARDRILEKRWDFIPEQTRTEFTLIAPGLAGKAEAEIPLESRDACFNLIDAELRHVAGVSGVERAILRWQPVRRTIPTANLHIALALQSLVQERSPDAARFYWNAQWNCGPLYWRQPRHVYLLVEKANDGSMMLVTRSDSITEGLADLRTVRLKALGQLRDPLAEHGILPVGAELAAPWDPENLEPAAELTVAYFKMLRELGFLDLDKYAWYRRPQSTQAGQHKSGR